MSESILVFILFPRKHSFNSLGQVLQWAVAECLEALVRRLRIGQNTCVMLVNSH